MKKVLSILMVAVLSLNLLYQPCVATNDKKEAVSSVTQESPKVGDETSKKSSDEKSKIKRFLSFNWWMIKLYLKLKFVVSMCKGIYNTGYKVGQVDAEDTCSDMLINAMGEAYNDGYMSTTREWNKKCHDMGNFPLDKMSKKCLKHTLVSLHPDRFQCYEDIKDFYVKAQEAYEKKK